MPRRPVPSSALKHTRKPVVRRIWIVVAVLMTFWVRFSVPVEAALPVADAGGAMEDAEFYSGVECLGRGMALLGRPVDMVKLLGSTSPGSETGSPQALARLAARQKLYPLVLDSFTQDQIARCPFPMVIRVKGGRYSVDPDYYVLCTGIREGSVELFSPSVGELRVPLNQFDADRRAQAILLSPVPIAASDPVLRRSLPIGRCLMMGGVVVGFAALASTRRGSDLFDSRLYGDRPIALSAAGLLGIISAALVLSVACRLVSGESIVPVAPAPSGHPIDFFLANPANPANPARTIARPTGIDLRTALVLFHSGALFVDARDLADYSGGHISGAVLCPATDINRWHLHLAGVDSHRKIVVYCAEASCGKGDYVATFLLTNGFADVSLYRDGWAKWTGPKEAR